MGDAAHVAGDSEGESLVLLDEFGVGTSAEEGAALAWALTEALLLSGGAAVVLATHAGLLTRMASLYPSVANYHLESEASPDGRLRLTHVVRKGVTLAAHYGLALAALTPMPPAVLGRARELALAMAPSTQVREEEEDGEGVRRRAVYHLAHRLVALAGAPAPGGSGGAVAAPEGAEAVLREEERGGDDAEEPAAATGRDEELRGQLKALLQEFLGQVAQAEAPEGSD